MDEYEGLVLRLERLASRSGTTRLAKASAHAADVLRALDRRKHDSGDVGEFLQLYREALDGTPQTRRLSQVTSSLLGYLEKAHGLVPPRHYQNQWMALGMTAFGLPLGFAFGLVLDNMAFLGIGIPLGLSIGLSLGSARDKQAARQGRRLEMPET